VATNSFAARAPALLTHTLELQTWVAELKAVQVEFPNAGSGSVLIGRQWTLLL
jgi:hypothetical protein